MDKDNSGIENLYNSSFQNFKIDTGEDSWDEIDFKLSANKFLSFNVTQFNVYYAAAICLSMLLTSSIAFDYFFLRPEREIFKHALLINDSKTSNAIDENNALEIEKKNNDYSNTVIVVEKNSKSKNQSAPSSKKISPSQDRKSVSVKDSLDQKLKVNNAVRAIVKEDSIANKKQILSKEEKNKTVYIIRQDTLIVVDSLKPKTRKRNIVK